MKDPYKILGIKSDATFHQIKKAYFSKVKAFSPERYPQEFKRIREAYELLKDEKGRKESEFFQFKEFQPKFYKIESLEKEIKLNIEELTTFQKNGEPRSTSKPWYLETWEKILALGWLSPATLQQGRTYSMANISSMLRGKTWLQA